MRLKRNSKNREDDEMLHCPVCCDELPERNYWPLIPIVLMRTVAYRGDGEVTCGQAQEFFLGPTREMEQWVAAEEIRCLVEKKRRSRGKTSEVEIAGFAERVVKPCHCTSHIREGRFTGLESRRVLPGLV
ncbi:MAG: hypothetical protein HYW38_00030 [Candidatus Colwellbacteria bacterium]|nr:hypothetical protein [Candidatus Colwellbacteria bacterium]